MAETEQQKDMNLKLTPSIRPDVILAPHLRAGLRVLQMDWHALAGEIRHEAEVNPVVELENPDDLPVISDELHEAERIDAQDVSPTDMDEPNLTTSPDEAAAERRQRFFERQVAVESLQEHLLRQIGPSGLSEGDGVLAELIIGDVDEDGRYVGSLDELSSVTGVPVDHVEEVLARVQEFDPPGVAGRHLRECLQIQVRQLDVAPELRRLLGRIVAGRLTAVVRRETKRLAAKLGSSEEDCLKALKLLRSLEPKPGRPFLPSGRHPQFIRPELEIVANGDNMTLVSCENDLPKLTVSPFYREMMEDEGTAGETRRYLRERIDHAEQLQDAIRRRGETVMKVAEVVFAEQYDFFTHGFEALRPLTIEEVARRTGYHGTTVGRAIRGKYVRTPRGTFELRRFFCVGHLGGSCSGVSATTVKCRLAALVSGEEIPSDVRTDDELALALKSTGLEISRRTIAKYRTELKIPSSAMRTRIMKGNLT